MGFVTLARQYVHFLSACCNDSESCMRGNIKKWKKDIGKKLEDKR